MKKILMIFVMMVFGCASVLGQKYYNPTFNNGFQWELEGGPCSSLSVSYKFAKRFSIGAGYQYGICVNGFLNKTKRSVTIQRNYSTTNNNDKSPSTIHRSDDWIDGMNGPTDSKFQKYFVNFQIRPVNRAFSPILGINVGQMTIHLDDYWYPYYGDEQRMLTLTPYAGMSIRLGRNSFLGLKFGVDNFGSKIAPTGDQQVEKRTIYDHGTPNYYVETTITDFPDVDISNIYLAINFTHTMNFGHGYTEKRRIAEYRASHPKVKKERDGHVLDAIANVLEVTNNALGETAKTLNQMQGNNNVAAPSGNYSGNYNQNYNSGNYSGSNYNINIPKVIWPAAPKEKNYIPEGWDMSGCQKVSEDATTITYKGKNKSSGEEFTMFISKRCFSCNSTGQCYNCHGTGVYYSVQQYFSCPTCLNTGKCTNCNGRGYEITQVYSNGYIVTHGSNPTIKTKEQLELEQEQKQAERERNGGMTDEGKLKEQERHDNSCDSKYRNYLNFHNELLDMKSKGTVNPSRKQYLQSCMRRYRQECPEITKSSLEDW